MHKNSECSQMKYLQAVVALNGLEHIALIIIIDDVDNVLCTQFKEINLDVN